MSFMYVLAMTAAELVGNAHLKWFADEGKHHNLMFGILAWMAVLFFLIKTLSGASMMWTCIMWEAMIVIGGAITAWLFFGEKFTHWVQWLGLLFAVAAALCINYKCVDK
jgi:multidrug transporter EmrE-like cation transporter